MQLMNALFTICDCWVASSIIVIFFPMTKFTCLLILPDENVNVKELKYAKKEIQLYKQKIKGRPTMEFFLFWSNELSAMWI